MLKYNPLPEICILILCVCAVSGVALAIQQPKTPPAQTPRVETRPELTTQLIRAAIIGKVIKDIPPARSGDGGLSEWSFDDGELQEIDILEKTQEANKVTLVINMKTANAPGVLNEDEDETGKYYQIELSGKLRLRFEWVTGEWVLLGVENLTMKWMSHLAHVPD